MRENVCLLGSIGEVKGSKVGWSLVFFGFHVSHCRYWAAELRALAQVETVTGFLCGVWGILKGRPQRDSSCSICSATIPLHWVMLCDVFRTMCPGNLRDCLSFCPGIWLWQILLRLLHPPRDIFLGLRFKSCSQVFSNSATAQSCAMSHQLTLAWRKDSFLLFYDLHGFLPWTKLLLLSKLMQTRNIWQRIKKIHLSQKCTCSSWESVHVLNNSLFLLFNDNCVSNIPFLP